MSVAFTKEGDTENAAAVDLPDRPVSPHPNLVTPHGLALLEAALARARADYAANQIDGAQAAGAPAGDRRALARAARDLRYFAARCATAKVVAPPTDSAVVRFGATVTIRRADGREQVFRIVGEDEAEPQQGTVSHVSPVARALLGKGAGEEASLAGAAVEILAIGPA